MPFLITQPKVDHALPTAQMLLFIAFFFLIEHVLQITIIYVCTLVSLLFCFCFSSLS